MTSPSAHGDQLHPDLPLSSQSSSSLPSSLAQRPMSSTTQTLHQHTFRNSTFLLDRCPANKLPLTQGLSSLDIDLTANLETQMNVYRRSGELRQCITAIGFVVLGVITLCSSTTFLAQVWREHAETHSHSMSKNAPLSQTLT